MQQAREPVFLLGPDARIAMVNPAWEELTGRRADEVIGQVCRPGDSGQFGDLEADLASFAPPPEALQGQPCGLITLIVQAGGDRLWRRVEFWPFHDVRDTMIGLIGLIRLCEEPAQVPEPESQRLRTELLELREGLNRRHGFDVLIGRGAEHRRLLDQVTAASTTAVPVLIVGEPGTGKLLVARTIHHRGSHRTAPVLIHDCKTLPPEVLERQLFGLPLEPSRRSIAGVEGATVLVDEVLELPRDLQARLVSGLEDGRVRLIATTSGDPDLALRSEQLRPDLYYTLTTLVIRVRPLRERLDELPLLAQHLLERANLRGVRRREGFSRSAIDALLAYDWPGNLHELGRVVDEAHSRGSTPLIQVDEIPAAIRGERGGAYLMSALPAGPIPLKEMLTRVERRLIEKALERSGDNKSRAAKLLGINRPYLYRRIKELGIADPLDPSDDPPAKAPTSP